uniref:Uncharacterized protein n=1 Tax=Lotharella globosa TaxID=91324 RepID=A0A7S4DII5_9EUKA
MMYVTFIIAVMAGTATSLWKGTGGGMDPQPQGQPELAKLDKELVVIRTYNPSESMKARFQRIISELYDREVIISTTEHLDKGVYLTSNEDGTLREHPRQMPEEYYVPMMQREAQGHAELIKEFGSRVFVFTDEMVDEKFPTLRALPKLPMHLYDDPRYGPQWFVSFDAHPYRYKLPLS